MGIRFNAQITYEDVDPDIEYVNDKDGMLVSYDDYASLEDVYFRAYGVAKAAVEWYDAGMELDGKIKSGVMDGYEVCQRKTWDAEQALAEAVKAWKEAQA